MRPIHKIGAAILAGAIPLGLVYNGCNKNGTEPVKEEPTINKISDAFQFKRNENGKLFIESNNDFEKIKKSLNPLGVSDQDIGDLYSLQFQFNKRVDTLIQKEIKVSDLVNPHKSIGDALKKNDVFLATVHSHNSSFIPPFYNFDAERSQMIMLPIASDITTRRLLPLSISLQSEFRLVPESIRLRYYLDNVEPNVEQVKEGIYFKVRYNNEKDKNIEVVVPMCNLPISIDNGNELYIIGADKLGLKE